MLAQVLFSIVLYE